MTCRMGEPIRTGVRVCMPRIGMGKVCMPIIGNRSAYKAGGDDVLKDLKSHMLGWYDVKRQGCTNESLAENPVLEDLSGNNHPLELRNFAFGGLSGMGGYGTDLTKWIVDYNHVESINRTAYKAIVRISSNFAAAFRLRGDNTNPIYFRAKTDVPGVFNIATNIGTFSIEANEDGIFEVYRENFASLSFTPTAKLSEYTLEILPNFPNSLVFNGVTPEYVINRDNVTLSNVVTAIGVNKFKVTGNHFRALSLYKTGKAGESLTVSIPSFVVKILGLEEKSLVQINYKNSEGNAIYRNLVADGHYVIPAINYTLDAKEDGSAIRDEAIRILTDGNIHDVTLEFLPNYPSPTTTNYGEITTIPANTVKCMMMNFVPLAGNNYESWYYCQRKGSTRNFAVANFVSTDQVHDISKIVAYSARNTENSTYINGEINRTVSVLNLVHKNQVVSVNTNTPQHNTIYLRWDSGTYRNTPQMALNSLILFDRELTEKEMKLVMDKLMKYEDTDNIAGDLSRSANVLSLDDSDMYEEYDVYEEGNGVQDIWEME